MKSVLGHKVGGKVPTIIIVAILASALFLGLNQAGMPEPLENESFVAQQLIPEYPSEGTTEAAILITPSEEYGLLEDAKHRITLVIAASPDVRTVSPEVTVFFSADFSILSVSPAGANYSLGFEVEPFQRGVMKISLPPGVARIHR